MAPQVVFRLAPTRSAHRCELESSRETVLTFGRNGTPSRLQARPDSLRSSLRARILTQATLLRPESHPRSSSGSPRLAPLIVASSNPPHESNPPHLRTEWHLRGAFRLDGLAWAWRFEDGGMRRDPQDARQHRLEQRDGLGAVQRILQPVASERRQTNRRPAPGASLRQTGAERFLHESLRRERGEPSYAVVCQRARCPMTSRNS